MELMLLGEKLPAKTAAEWGLINRCVPDAELMADGHGARPRAGQTARQSLGLIRAPGLGQRSTPTWHDQLEAEAYAQGDAGRTEDFREGVMAFVQKRPPNSRAASRHL